MIKLKDLISEKYEFSHLAKEYRLYEGTDHIVAIFEDNSRLMFKVHFRDKHGEDRNKHRKKAASKWKTLATRIHNEKELTEQGNFIIKSWKECFGAALKNPEMNEYIRKKNNSKVFGQ